MRVTPADGVRAGYRDQTWRMTGRLVTSDGVAFSYAAIFFRYLEPNGVVLYPASLSVVEESSGRYFSERRTERADFGLAQAATGALDIRVGTWRLREFPVDGSGPAFDLEAKLAGITLTLHGIARKREFVTRSATAELDGYSLISCDGLIAIDGRTHPVRGKAWLDHEMSRHVENASPAFSQFRIQLDDETEIYLETSDSGSARRARRSAYFIERDGTVDTLRPASYGLGERAGATWHSPHTRTTYPDTWGLQVVGKTGFLSLEPVSYDQESLARGVGLSYWDGAVDVYDLTQGRRLGSGYVFMLSRTSKPHKT